MTGADGVFDPGIDKFFPLEQSAKPARRANPVADIPYADDEIQEVSTPTTRHTAPSDSGNPSRITRASRQSKEKSTDSDREEVRLLGGLRRRQKDETIVPDPMAANKKFLTRVGFKPMNKLDVPSNSKAGYVAQNTRRSNYGSRSFTLPTDANSQLSNDKKTPTGPSSIRVDADPPYKKPRLGPSPMQGRTKHDAISVDESQEHEEIQDDEIQYTPNRKPRARDHATPYYVHPRGGATGTRSTARQQAPNGTSGSHSDNDDVIMLASGRQPKSKRHPSSDQALVNRDDHDIDSDEERAVEIVKEATRRRKAGVDSSSPVPDGSKVQRRIDAPYFTSGTPVDAQQARSQRKEQSPTKHRTRVDGSQSPDVLQEGTTTQGARLPGHGRPIQQRKGPSSLTASPIAANITGNPDSTKITRKGKSKEKHLHQECARFELRDVRYHGLSHLPAKTLRELCFVIHFREKSFYFDYKNATLGDSDEDSTEAVSIAHQISRINHVKYGQGSSCIVMLKLSMLEGGPYGPIGLELESHFYVIKLIEALKKVDDTFDITDEEGDRILRMFEKVDTEQARFASNQTRTVGNHDRYQGKVDTPNIRMPTTDGTLQKPTRLVDGLDVPRVARPQNKTIITGRDREFASRHPSEEPVEHRPSGTRRTAPRDEHASQFTSHYFGEHTTRAQSLRSATATEKRKAKSPSPPRTKFSKTGQLGEPWKKPLVYPKEGKKRESIGFDELWRLDEDEFLNDTLIGFFLRYLQHRIEIERPDVLKKMHFFNSYFFDSLNKGTKSVKSINYEAVARWTRTIDLFSRDFVIVPVNENLHWFVAIICNLPYLKPNAKEVNVEDDEDLPSAVTIEDDQDDAVDQGRRTNETQKSFEELTIEDKEPPTSSTITSSQNKETPKAGRGRKKKARRSLPKYDTTKPVIITLDSLGLSRSNICSVLKQYMVREAKDKKDFEISDSEIKGMTAKGIPTQTNYSDCGLYMCMYLEQFMCDPYGFVRKLLQREESEMRWPHKIRSDELRARMRDLILELHRQQEGEEEKMKISELGKILVDMREPSPEPEPEVVGDSPPPLPSPPTSSEDILAQKQRFSNHVNNASAAPEDDDGFEPEADEWPISVSSQKRHAEEARALVDAPTEQSAENTITIDDDGSPVKKKQRVSLDAVSPRNWQHNGPKELTARLKVARGSPAQSASKRRGMSPAKEERDLRSTSVSTDFLSGIESFAKGETGSAIQHHGPGVATGERQPLREIELPGEIPDSQQEAAGNEDGGEQDLDVQELKSREDDGRAGTDEMLL